MKLNKAEKQAIIAAVTPSFLERGALWFAENEIDKVISEKKQKYDPEIQAMYRGFALLKGNTLNFGN